MRINIATIVGVLLIIVSGIALVSKGISYTREEKVLDIGPIEATAEEREFIPIPVWAAGLMLATGVILVVAGVRARP
jgi:hypothetical protein